jgi:hypothetical protein
MQGPAKLATYIGVTSALLGFALIGLAWNGAAELDYIQGQLPYALSGGLGGLGLIVTGMAVLGVQAMRTITAQRAREMGRLQDEADKLIRLLVQPGPGEVIEDETVIDVGARTVVRTIERRPATEAEQAVASAPVATSGFAPKPRMTVDDAATESPTPVAVLQRDDEAVWAPADADEDRLTEVLAGVSGVGPAKQQLLVERFGSLEALRRAERSDLTGLPGISPTLADRILAAVR